MFSKTAHSFYPLETYYAFIVAIALIGEPPVFNVIHESDLYPVEDKEVNMRERLYADSLDELSTSSTANGPQLSGECCNREV